MLQYIFIHAKATRTVPSAVLAVGLRTSQMKFHNFHDHSLRYVSSEFSCSFWFSTDGLLTMSVSISPSITSVHLPLNNIGTMVSKRADMKKPFRACLGMQSIKCPWAYLLMKTSCCSWTRTSSSNIIVTNIINNS